MNKSLELTATELSWVGLALQSYRNVISRRQSKENTLGDLFPIYGKQIQEIDALMGKLK